MLKKLALAYLCVSSWHAFGANDVDMQIIPDRPIVITADYTDSNQIVWKAPWFSYHVEVANHSNKPVTLMAFEVTTTAKKTDGTTVVKGPQTISPSTYNYTVTCGTASAEASFVSFGTIPPRSTQYITLTYDAGNSTPIGQICGNAFDPNISNPMIIVPGNPDMTNDHAASYRYSVQIQVVGWYGTLNNIEIRPSSRFEKTLHIPRRYRQTVSARDLKTGAAAAPVFI